jgi:hypothetical protein
MEGLDENSISGLMTEHVADNIYKFHLMTGMNEDHFYEFYLRFEDKKGWI